MLDAIRETPHILIALFFGAVALWWVASLFRPTPDARAWDGVDTRVYGPDGDVDCYKGDVYAYTLIPYEGKVWRAPAERHERGEF